MTVLEHWKNLKYHLSIRTVYPLHWFGISLKYSPSETFSVNRLSIQTLQKGIIMLQRLQMCMQTNRAFKFVRHRMCIYIVHCLVNSNVIIQTIINLLWNSLNIIIVSMIFNEILNFVYTYLFSWPLFLESVYFTFPLKKSLGTQCTN